MKTAVICLRLGDKKGKIEFKNIAEESCLEICGQSILAWFDFFLSCPIYNVEAIDFF